MEQKIYRKQNKYKSILRKDFGISSSASSKHLMICNVGVSTNATTETLLNVFSTFGAVKDIVMPFYKSYSFVSFACEEIAVSCYERLNGSAFLQGMSGPVFLLFVCDVPKIESPSKFGFLPDGISLIEDFVTIEEEAELLRCIKFDGLQQTELKHRLVQHFGYEFKYGTNNVDKNSPLDEKIPEECERILDRLDLGCWRPNQMTVNRYEPGQGIPMHIDTHSAFDETILSLSLSSGTIMDFKNDDGKVLSVVLPRRSLLVMSGEGRYAWKHGISPRKCDMIPTESGYEVQARGTRTSLTLRCVRDDPCACNYPCHCDSQRNEISDTMAESFENGYVHQVYDSISEHFSETRHKPWPKILEFVQSLPPGSVLVDIGCGNGKYFGHNTQIHELGVDRCHKLTEISHQRGFQVLQGSCLSLPLRDGIADAVICIAVIHHLSTQSRRLQAIKEMVRVLRPGGQALIYTWAKNQVRNDKMSSYLKQSRRNKKLIPQNITADPDDKFSNLNVRECSSAAYAPLITPVQVIPSPSSVADKTNLIPQINLPVHTNRTDFAQQDMFVPWKIKGKESTEVPTFLRFYHVFVENELENLCGELRNTAVLENYYDQGNWCVMLQKV